MLSSQLTIDVIAGINASKIYESRNFYKLGPLVGGRVKYYKTPRLKFGANLQYNRKGYKIKCARAGIPCSDKTFSRNPIGYFEFQPFMEYDLKKRFGVVFGFNFGILVSGDSFNDYEPNDYGIMLGIKYELNHRYTLSLYRTQGLRDVTEEPGWIPADFVSSVVNQIVLAYRVFSK